MSCAVSSHHEPVVILLVKPAFLFLETVDLAKPVMLPSSGESDTYETSSRHASEAVVYLFARRPIGQDCRHQVGLSRVC